MKNALLRSIIRFLLTTSCALPLLAPAQNPNADIYGTWKIKAMIGGGAASALSQRDVDRLIGKPVIISPEKFEFNGHTCVYPHYKRSKEETVHYFDWAWRTDVSDIPFPNPVTVIETGCNPLFPIRKNHLMIAEENVFLEAVRIDEIPKSTTRRRQ